MDKDLPSLIHISDAIGSCFRFLQHFALPRYAIEEAPLTSALDGRACFYCACAGRLL